ncbi:hypothetical protein [Mycobacterium asiaticum]|uniref:hypothetical protein n=1 Tax=Mycobacterium asiaticum TaxID=1790 RepID=UPI0007EF6D24|nr:hypothetical protein A9W94_08190 [Mycobacterium asiaticum]
MRGGRLDFGDDGIRRVAVALNERNGGLGSRSGPRLGQCGKLRALQLQGLGDHSAGLPQPCTIGVQRMEIESVFTAIQITDRQRIMAGPRISLGVLDGREAFGQASGDVQSIDHQAIRAAADNSASA